MASYQFDFANPSTYSDWAGYSGFNRKTGEIDLPASTGVAPPQNFSEFVSQQLQPVQQTIGNLGVAANQLGQGNFSQAFGTLKNARKPVPPGQLPAVTMQPQAPQPDTGYNYSHNIEQPGS
jgi:hypothetical protein